MNRKQFAVIAVFTAMETYFFNEATMAGQMLFACFWALLILRNLQMAYMVEKIASAIEKEIKKKRKKIYSYKKSHYGCIFNNSNINSTMWNIFIFFYFIFK